MSYLAILKRIVPFIATFTAGLLIASIFVPITAPNFSRFDRGRSRRHRYQMRYDYYQLKAENERLRTENQLLKQQQDQWAPHSVPLVQPFFDEQEGPKRPRRPRHPRD